jgi:tRNA pseudouridine32 synthase/23S rRNA pseudouridine746 synthase
LEFQRIAIMSVAMTPEELNSRLIYRDALMLVLNKPAGIPVHKGTGGGDTLERHFEALRFGLPRVPSLAHRLDRDTSGCLILGRHRQALHRLGNMFAANQIKKTYWAIVSGSPESDEGNIELSLAKQSESPKRWWMKVAEDGLSALTHYRVLGKADGMSWLELQPKTGRTHQLRVHCAAIGCPIIGDTIYGGDVAKQGMMRLHARSIEIPLYPKKDPIVVTAPAPEHMLGFITPLGYL